MKRFYSVLLLLFVLIVIPNQLSANTTQELLHQKDLYDSFITLLDPYSSKEIHKRNPNRSYGLYDVEVKSIQRCVDGEYTFKVTVIYKTYEGPHNPPYGIETLTFMVSLGNVELLHYKHEDVT